MYIGVTVHKEVVEGFWYSEMWIQVFYGMYSERLVTEFVCIVMTQKCCSTYMYV